MRTRTCRGTPACNAHTLHTRNKSDNKSDVLFLSAGRCPFSTAVHVPRSCLRVTPKKKNRTSPLNINNREAAAVVLRPSYTMRTLGT